MPTTYYEHVRSEIAPLLPQTVSRSLEIGCGAGATSSWLKSQKNCYTAGVELMPDVAVQARQRMDCVLAGSFMGTELHFEPASFDLILCLDVLEHLPDPWEALARLREYMTAGGCLIASLPNVRHLRVTAPLIFGGRFEYQDEGILDRTHLRFFTKRSAVELVRSSGLRVDKVSENISSKLRWLAPALGPLREFVTIQYLVRGRN